MTLSTQERYMTLSQGSHLAKKVTNNFKGFGYFVVVVVFSNLVRQQEQR